MDKLDLDQLEALAHAATPGPWEATRQTDDECCHAGYFIEATDKTISDDGTAPGDSDALFIAAANPSTLLKLIELARRSIPQGEEPAKGAAQGDELPPLPEMPRSPVTHSQLGPLFDRTSMHQYAVRYVDLYREYGAACRAGEKAERVYQVRTTPDNWHDVSKDKYEFYADSCRRTLYTMRAGEKADARDAARLDWLEQSDRTFCGNKDGSGFRMIGASVWHGSLREAIDAALSDHTGGKEGTST